MNVEIEEGNSFLDVNVYWNDQGCIDVDQPARQFNINYSLVPKYDHI